MWLATALGLLLRSQRSSSTIRCTVPTTEEEILAEPILIDLPFVYNGELSYTCILRNNRLQGPLFVPKDSRETSSETEWADCECAEYVCQIDAFI